MNRIISATEARVHFGQLMQDVVATNQPVIVQRAGQPQVVVLPVGEFERMQRMSERHQDEEILQFLKSMAETIRERQQTQSIPAPEDVIRQMREERDYDHFAHLR